MSLKETYKQTRELLTHILADLEKSENGNKAASQRVRTGTVKLEKIAKLFRKESIAFEKKHREQKKSGKGARSSKSAPATTAKGAKGAAAAKTAPATKAKAPAAKAKPKEKAVHARTTVKPRELSAKRHPAKGTARTSHNH